MRGTFAAHFLCPTLLLLSGELPAGNISAPPRPPGATIQSAGTAPNSLDEFRIADQYCSTPGSLDDTCIRNAIASIPADKPGLVFVPPGVFVFQGGVSILRNNLKLLGSGVGVTVFETSDPAVPGIVIGSPGGDVIGSITIEGIFFHQKAGVFPTQPAITLDHTNTVSISSVRVWGFSDSLLVRNNSYNTRVSGFQFEAFENGVHIANGSSLTDGDLSLVLSNGFLNAAWPLGRGIHWTSGNRLTVTDVQIVNGAIAIDIDPTQDRRAALGVFQGVVGDSTSQVVWQVKPLGTGVVAAITATNCAAISSQNAVGIMLGAGLPGEGTIDGFRWVAGKVMNNRSHGVWLRGGGQFSSVAIQNSDVAGNSSQYPGFFDGIHVEGGVSGFLVTGNRIGPALGQANYQRYGVFVGGGDSDHYIVNQNDLHGNVTGGLSDGGTGAQKIVSPNL